MSDINKGPAKGSGSDTVSAARAATGGGGASKTPGSQSPGSAATSTTGPQGAAQSSGPEHNLHQDKAAAPAGTTGQTPGAQSGRSGAEAATQATKEAADRVRQVASSVRDTAGEMYEEATDWASEHLGRGGRQPANRRRGMQGASSAQHTIERFIAENPVLVGVVGLAAGLLVGALLPRTRPEDRTFGAWADEVRDQGLRYARDVTHRGREFVEQALSDEDSDSGGSPDPRRGEPRGQRSGPAGRYQNH